VNTSFRVVCELGLLAARFRSSDGMTSHPFERTRIAAEGVVTSGASFGRPDGEVRSVALCRHAMLRFRDEPRDFSEGLAQPHR